MWQKFKDFLSKSWGYIAAFAGGIVSMLFFKRRGDTRARADIEELRNKLQQYSDLVKQTGRANQKLTKQLDELTRRYNELKSRVGDCKGDAEELDRINGDIGEELVRMDSAIQSLREFIGKNGK